MQCAIIKSRLQPIHCCWWGAARAHQCAYGQHYCERHRWQWRPARRYSFADFIALAEPHNSPRVAWSEARRVAAADLPRSPPGRHGGAQGEERGSPCSGGNAAQFSVSIRSSSGVGLRPPRICGGCGGSDALRSARPARRRARPQPWPRGPTLNPNSAHSGVEVWARARMGTASRAG